jgi:ketosteroid isomerase-like protein
MDEMRERGRILKVLEQEAAAISNGDFEVYRAVLEEDAVFLPPNTEIKKGADLQRWLQDFLETVSVQWLNMTHVELVVAADHACHVFTCSWRATPRAGGEARVMHFKGMHILRRSRKGAWKIAREIWNTSPPS